MLNGADQRHILDDKTPTFVDWCSLTFLINKFGVETTSASSQTDAQ